MKDREPETPRLYLSKVEFEAMLDELMAKKFDPEFYELKQSMLEVRARLGGLVAVLDARYLKEEALREEKEDALAETPRKRHTPEEGL